MSLNPRKGANNHFWIRIRWAAPDLERCDYCGEMRWSVRPVGKLTTVRLYSGGPAVSAWSRTKPNCIPKRASQRQSKDSP
jgi:hypothetical protein